MEDSVKRETLILNQTVFVDALLSGRDPREKAEFASLMSRAQLKLDIDLEGLHEVVRDQYEMAALDEYQAFLDTLPPEVRAALKAAQEAFKKAGISAGIAMVPCTNHDCHPDHEHGL